MSIFIKKERDTERPKDGILLRGEQVAGFYEVVVETWKPQSEIWALAHGPKILGVAGALSGLYGSIHFRRKLRLKHYGAATTYLPNLILPYLLAQSAHMLVTNHSNHSINFTIIKIAYISYKTICLLFAILVGNQ